MYHACAHNEKEITVMHGEMEVIDPKCRVRLEHSTFCWVKLKSARNSACVTQGIEAHWRMGGHTSQCGRRGMLQEAAHKVNCLCLGVHGLNTWGGVGRDVMGMNIW